MFLTQVKCSIVYTTSHSFLLLAIPLVLSYTDDATEKYRRNPLQIVVYMERMYCVCAH